MNGRVLVGGVLVALVAGTGFVASSQQPVNCPGPVTHALLTRLLNEGVSERRVVQVISTCGVAFELTPEREELLRAVNATDAVIAAILREERKKADAAHALQREAEVRALAAEQAAWDVVKGSDDPRVFEEFLRQYPSGEYAASARERLAAARAARPSTSKAGPDSAGPGVENDTVYLIVGGVIYHRKDCDSLAGHRLVAKRRSQLGPTNEPCSRCLPTSVDSSGSRAPRPSSPSSSAAGLYSGDPGVESDTVYLIVGGVIYHRKDCDSLAGHKLVARRRSQLGPTNEPCSRCLPPIRDALVTTHPDAYDRAPAVERR